MHNKQQDWPSVSVSEADQTIIKEIVRYPGILQNADAKDILMIAAALAIELDLPDLPAEKGKTTKKDVIHQSLLRSPAYHEYRQYMLLICYLTDGNRDLKMLGDFKVVTDSFVRRAKAGLHYLKMEYLKPDGSEKLEELFGNYIDKFSKKKVE